MMLRGYRDDDKVLLTGRWLQGELLGLPVPGMPPLAEPSSLAPPADDDEELCVVPGVAFVRYTGLDWVHRRARVEIGVREGQVGAAGTLARMAADHGLLELRLHRLYGWCTPAATPTAPLLAGAGFRREVSVPGGFWLAGELVEREIWAVTEDD